MKSFLSSFQVHPEGKFVVDLDKNIDINDVTPNCRVALRNDSYTLHKILPNKVSILLHVLLIYKGKLIELYTVKGSMENMDIHINFVDICLHFLDST